MYVQYVQTTTHLPDTRISLKRISVIAALISFQLHIKRGFLIMNYSLRTVKYGKCKHSAYGITSEKVGIGKCSHT